MNVTPHELKELLAILSNEETPVCTEQKPAGLELFIAQPDGVKFIGQPSITKSSETNDTVSFIVHCHIKPDGVEIKQKSMPLQCLTAEPLPKVR